MSWNQHYVSRTYRVVKLVLADQDAWLVVSSSLRDDDTWDVIARFRWRGEAQDYVEQVTERNRALAREVGCMA